MAYVTVIVPNYNHERYLRRRIDSILNQTYTNYEIILLDDRSTDASRAIIEEYRENTKVHRINYNDRNSGSPFRQWIKGILMARSEYIWIAESDDYAHAEFLETLIGLTEKHPNVAIAYANSHKVDEDEHMLDELHTYMDREFKNGIEEVKTRMCMYNTITNASSCVIKTAYALRAVEGLEQFRTCGDWIFYVRVLQQGNLAYTPQKLNYYRWHVNSVSFSASQTTMYITEGINLLRYLDFEKINFSVREFMAVYKAWITKIWHAEGAHLLPAIKILAEVASRYCEAKIIPDAK